VERSLRQLKRVPRINTPLRKCKRNTSSIILVRFKNFAEGKPLKRFDLYMDEELGRRDLKKCKLLKYLIIVQ